jgi:hypothetical protein
MQRRNTFRNTQMQRYATVVQRHEILTFTSRYGHG